MKDIQSRIMHAEINGASREEMKRLHIEQNIFDLNNDEQIFRILDFDHFLYDLENARLTMPEVNRSSFNCSQENPLYGKYIDLDGEPTLMESCLEGYFASCWSLEAQPRWEEFGSSPLYGGENLRISSTPLRLMNSLCDINDQFYMLHSFIGRMIYIPIEETTKWANSRTADTLDSLGHNFARSFYRLDDKDYGTELEVRLLYNRQPQDNEYVLHNVPTFKKEGVNLCSVPFDWSGVITNIEFQHELQEPRKSEINRILSKYGLAYI